MFFPRGQTNSSEACCNSSHLKNCWSAEVDADILRTREDINILDVDLKFDSTIPPNGNVYKNAKGDEAIITYNANTGNMLGSLKTHQGRSYSFHKCHNGYVWKEFDVDSFLDD